MANRSKKTSLKKWQIKLADIIIDLRHFGYKCFVYSALKFQIPETCICRWNNIQEFDKTIQQVCSVIFRTIFKHQIALRSELYEVFKPLSESNDLQSFQKIKRVLQEATSKSMNFENLTIIEEVEISIAVVCELILFLYSKDSNLYLMELVNFWFNWIQPQKKRFEKSSGIDAIYMKAVVEVDGTTRPSKKSHVSWDNLIYEFVLHNCVPYQETMEESKQFVNQFIALGASRGYDMNIYFLRRECQKRQQEVGQNKPSRVEDSSRTSAPVPILKEDEDSGACASENTGLGIRPHEELLQSIGATASADATPSQTLVGTHPPEPPRRRRGSSGRPRRRTNSSLHSGVGKDFERLSLDSSGTKQSGKEKPSVRVDDVATQSQRLLEEIPKKPAKEDSSSDSKEDSGAYAFENTGLGIRPQELLQCIGATASADATPSQTLVGTHRQKPPRRRKGSSGHQRRTSTTSSSHLGVEQDFERLNLDSSGRKQSSKEKSSVRLDDVATQSQRLLGAIPKKPAKEDSNSDPKEDSNSDSKADSNRDSTSE